MNRRTQAERRAHKRAYERRATGGLPKYTPEIAAGLLAAAAAWLLFVILV